MIVSIDICPKGKTFAEKTIFAKHGFEIKGKLAQIRHPQEFLLTISEYFLRFKFDWKIKFSKTEPEDGPDILEWLKADAEARVARAFIIGKPVWFRGRKYKGRIGRYAFLRAITKVKEAYFVAVESDDHVVLMTPEPIKVAEDGD